MGVKFRLLLGVQFAGGGNLVFEGPDIGGGPISLVGKGKVAVGNVADGGGAGL